MMEDALCGEMQQCRTPARSVVEAVRAQGYRCRREPRALVSLCITCKEKQNT